MGPVMIYLVYVAALLYFLYKIIPSLAEFFRLRAYINRLPTLKGYPFIGITLEVIQLKKEEQLQFVVNNALKHKDGFFSYCVGGDALVHINSPKHLEITISNNALITKARHYDCVTPYLERGLITSTGEKWFRDRRMLTPSFHFNILEEFAPMIARKADDLVRNIDDALKKNPGKPLNVFTYCIRSALEIICETSLGIDLNAEGEKGEEYVRNIHRFSDLAFARFPRPWLHYDSIFYLTPWGIEFKRIVRSMHQFSINIITKKIEKRKLQKEMKRNKTENDIGVKERKALLDYMLDASENSEKPLTPNEIREQVDTFTFAGHDTTGTAITWALYCIGNEPHHQEKLHEEIERVFGNSTERATLKELNQLKYLERVLKESLRLYPSVPIFGRKVLEDFKLEEYTIPRGSTLTFCPFATHRLPDFWPDPETFDPDRFLPENLKDKPAYAYIPFSAGPRNCIGQKFAQMEEKAVVCAILRKWRLKSVVPYNQMKLSMDLVLRPLEGAYLHFIPK